MMDRSLRVRQQHMFFPMLHVGLCIIFIYHGLASVARAFPTVSSSNGLFGIPGRRGQVGKAAFRGASCPGAVLRERSTIFENEVLASKSVPKKQIIIVGGGVGGLAIACRIAAADKKTNAVPKCNITILEKNPRMGGRCGSFEVEVPGVKGTFRHERGPSLLLLPQVYHELFLDCDALAERYGLKMIPCVPAYQVIFSDGDRVEVGFPRKKGSDISAAELNSRRLMDSFEPDGSLKFDEYLRACEAYLDCGLPNFIEERLDLGSFPAFLRESLRDFGRCWPLKAHSDVLDAIFVSDKMRALASFQNLYVGLEPYRNTNKIADGILETTAPAVFGLLSAIELHPTNEKCGVMAPIGGFQKVTDSFQSLAQDLGVSLQCNKAVTKVANDGVSYVDETSGKESYLAADLIVVNADLPYAKKVLLKDNCSTNKQIFDWEDRRGDSLKYLFSSGVIAFHWSVSEELTDLNTHNVFLTSTNRKEAEHSWAVLRQEGGPASIDAINFYVHRPGKVDPTAAPEGSDSILVLVPCETLSRMPECADLPREEAIKKYKEQFNEAYVDKIREAVFRRMGAVESLSNIRSYILDEVVDTPATYANDYNCAAGTPFALSHGLAQLSITRPGPLSSGYEKVVMVGASSRPGNGVPLVLLGAKKAAEIVCKRLETTS